MALPANEYQQIHSPEEDRAMIKQALTLLQDAIKQGRRVGENVTSFQWISFKYRHLLEYAYEEIKKAVDVIDIVERDFERATPAERQHMEERTDAWLLAELDLELQVIEELYGPWERAFEGDPYCKSIIKNWNPTFTPKLIDEALEHIEKRFGKLLLAPRQKIPNPRERIREAKIRLGSILNHNHIETIPQQVEKQVEKGKSVATFDRRSFFRIAGVATSVALSASLLHKIASDQPLLEEDIMPQEAKKEPKKALVAGVHLQFAAERDLERAKETVEKLNQEIALADLKSDHIHIIIHYYFNSRGEPKDGFPYKLITEETWGVGEEAVEKAVDFVEFLLPSLPESWRELAVVTVDIRGNITWEAIRSKISQRYHLDLHGPMPADPLDRLNAFLTVVRQRITNYPIITRIRKNIFIDERIIWAIICVESAFNHKAQSRVGAMGLMQVMPLIWKTFHGHSTLYPHKKKGGKLELKERKLVAVPGDGGRVHICMPSDYRQNIDCGVAYLRELFWKAHREGWPRYWQGTELPQYSKEVPEGFDFVIMAYNAGETIIRQFIRGKRKRVPRETYNYLLKVRKEYERLRNFGQRVEPRIANIQNLPYIPK